MSSVRTTLRADAQQSTSSTPKMSFFTIPTGAPTVAATRSIASQARSRLLILTFNISRLPSPRKRAMAGGSHGYRAALARRQNTPGLISSLPGTVGLPPFISSSTNSEVRRGAEVCIAVGDSARGAPRRRLVGPIEIGVRDDLVWRRCSPRGSVLGGVSVAYEGYVVSSHECSVNGRTDAGIALSTSDDKLSNAQTGQDRF